MDDHSKLQLIYKLHAHMCVIAKSYRYVQNVKDWRSRYHKLYIKMLNCTNGVYSNVAKVKCKTFYCCNLQYEKKIMLKFILNISFYPFCTRHKIK